MPPAPKHNWSYLYEVYQKLLEEKPGMSSSEFARQNGVAEEACRKAFKRIETKRAKRTIRTQTGRTNRPKRPGIFDDITPEETVEVVQQVCSARVVAVHAKILAILCTELNHVEELQKTRSEKEEDGKYKIKIETTKEIKDSIQTSNEIVKACRELMPFIMELKDRTGLEDILSRLQGREYDVTQAALEISKMGASLPEALKIMLSKTPPVVIANNFEMPDMNELDQRALETLQQVQWQYERFLPERREEVIQMKKKMQRAESFAPEGE